MAYYTINLLAGVPYTQETSGLLILIDSIGVAQGVDVTPIRNTAEQKTMPGRKAAFKYAVQFDAVKFQAAVDCTIAVFLTVNEVSLGFTEGATVNVAGAVNVTNDPAHSVPVIVENADPIPVLFAGMVAPVLGVVTVDNTDAEAIPVVQKMGAVFTVEQATEVDVRSYMAAIVTNGAPAAVTDAAGVLVALDATRRGLRIRNVGANPVAIGGAGIAFASAVAVIQPGETWNENEAPGAAWYCICAAGLASTLNIQTIA